jgi:MFS family permease
MTDGDPATASARAGARQGWLTRGVAGVGLASFFSDSGHEIATAILPTFIVSTLRGSAGTLGLIEGISDALTGIAKLIGGPLANQPARRRKMATGGYLVTAAATGAIGFATTIYQAGLLRATAWTARGIRSPARDTLLASLASPQTYGRAFGLERAGDNLGAVVGPLLASALVAIVGVRHAIYFAAVPGVFAALAITAAAREARRHETSTKERIRLEFGRLREARMARALAPVALFELGNVATTLLILRSTDLLHVHGRSLAAATSLAILLYAAHNAVAAGVAYAGGHWIDRAGPQRAFATGALVYLVAYAGFAFSLHSWVLLLLAFSLAGSGIGLAETAESALVAQRLPDEARGSGFGLLGGVQSFGDFASTAAVGALWTLVSPTLGFAYAAAWMLAAASTVRLTGPPQSP